MAREAISWEVFEHEHYHEEPEWYWVLGIIAVSGSMAAFLMGNLLFGILILLGGATMALHSTREPSFLRIELSKKGIRLNREQHSIESITSFSIDGEKLLIEKHAFWHPFIIIPIGEGVPPEEIRGVLGAKLPEKNHKEPAAHRIMGHFGF
ncbi:hypothetical protein KW797_04180 [Candidatus Parcubacteria bacterium]|nr:hypothetical protein [Candidatus Parcubacteria bacterium]